MPAADATHAKRSQAACFSRMVPRPGSAPVAGRRAPGHISPAVIEKERREYLQRVRDEHLAELAGTESTYSLDESDIPEAHDEGLQGAVAGADDDNFVYEDTAELEPPPKPDAACPPGTAGHRPSVRIRAGSTVLQPARHRMRSMGAVQPQDRAVATIDVDAIDSAAMAEAQLAALVQRHSAAPVVKPWRVAVHYQSPGAPVQASDEQGPQHSPASAQARFSCTSIDENTAGAHSSPALIAPACRADAPQFDTRPQLGRRQRPVSSHAISAQMQALAQERTGAQRRCRSAHPLHRRAGDSRGGKPTEFVPLVQPGADVLTWVGGSDCAAVAQVWCLCKRAHLLFRQCVSFLRNASQSEAAIRCMSAKQAGAHVLTAMPSGQEHEGKFA